MQQITINNWNLVKPKALEGHWITAKELGTHLGYSDPGDAVTKIYIRHQESFKENIDTCTPKLGVQLQARTIRVFSERGALKVIRYSNTAMANAVMDEVFDVYLAVRKKVQKQPAPVLAPLLPSPEDKATNIISNWMQVAQLFEVPKHYAQTEATKTAKEQTGVDYTPLLLKAPAQDNIPEEDLFLEVTEIGHRLKISAQKVNKFLASEDLQYREGKSWQVTKEGEQYSAIHHWVSGNKSGYNFKWKYSFLKKLWDEAQEFE